MRRNDRLIDDQEQIDDIIRVCQVCHLALCSGDNPYVVPMSFGYTGESLYFHSANQGRKIDLLRTNPNVAFSFVPEPRLTKHEKPCSWGFSYRSVVGKGRAIILDGVDAKRRGLQSIMAQYDDAKYTFEDRVVAPVCVIRVEIAELSGKGIRDSD